MKPQKYTISTSTHWFGDEIKTYAELYRELKDFSSVRKVLFDRNAFNNKSTAAAKDKISKVAYRAESLGEDGLVYLAGADYRDCKVLVLMTYLNRYRLPFEFIFESLVTQINDYEPQININEFDNFYYEKQALYPAELSLTPSTLKRIKSQLFNMLVHSGLLEKKSQGIYRLRKIQGTKELKEFLQGSPYRAMLE